MQKQRRNEFKKSAKELGISFIILFGSRANKKFHERSDFDIAVFFTDKTSFLGNLRLYSKTLDLLSRAMQIPPEKMDLTCLNDANILLRYEITAGGKLLFGNPVDFAQYRGFAFRDYIDAKPLFQLENLLISQKQKFIKQAI